MKLTAKLVSVLVLAIAVLFSVDAYITLQRDIELLEENKRLSVRLLAQAMRYVRQTYGPERVDQIIRTLNEEQDDFHVQWVWFQKPADRGGQLAADDSSFSAVMRGEVVLKRWTDAEGHERLSAFVRVTGSAQRPGGLEVSEPWPLGDLHLRSLVTHVLAMAGLMAVLGSVVAVCLGTEMIGRPLKLLIEKTRRVGRGDLSGPLQLRGHDELTELAGALNTMCDQLAESQEKFRQEEAARMAAMDQLRHVDRLRTVGGLASGVAHELGTPLSVVSGRAGLIASGKLSPEQAIDSAKAIKTESQRMAQIIQQLLDFARRSTPHKRPVDVRQVARQTVSLLEAIARKNHVTIDLGEPSEPLMALIDSGQIQQVLTNLVVNAIQAMPDGGPVAVRIERKCACPPAGCEGRQGPYLRIDVRDTGLGIRAEDKDHLFEPFFTTKGIGQGTGLGLSIAYGIVEEHGGWIEVESEPGRGSCFSVYLPEERRS